MTALFDVQAAPVAPVPPLAHVHEFAVHKVFPVDDCDHPVGQAVHSMRAPVVWLNRPVGQAWHAFFV